MSDKIETLSLSRNALTQIYKRFRKAQFERLTIKIQNNEIRLFTMNESGESLKILISQYGDVCIRKEYPDER